MMDGPRHIGLQERFFGRALDIHWEVFIKYGDGTPDVVLSGGDYPYFTMRGAKRAAEKATREYLETHEGDSTT
jgi:hypothetical protein